MQDRPIMDIKNMLSFPTPAAVAAAGLALALALGAPRTAAAANVDDRMAEFAALADKSKEEKNAARWQRPLPDEIDELGPVPGQGVLVGRTEISWDTDTYVPAYGPWALLDADTGAEKWTAKRDPNYDKAHRVLLAAPVVLLCAAGTEEASYTALDPATGKRLWSFEAKGTHSAGMDRERGLFFALELGTRKAALSARDLSGGKVSWSVGLDAAALGRAAPELRVVGDALVVAGADLRAYSAQTGAALWTRAEAGSFIGGGSLLAAEGGGLLALGRGGILLSLAADGRVEWSRDTGLGGAVLCAGDGRVLVEGGGPGEAGTLLCLSARDGTPLWRETLDGYLDSGLLCAEGRAVCEVRRADDAALFLELRDGASGGLVSRVRLPPETELRLPDRLVHRPGQVVLAGERWAGAFDLKDGAKRWFYAVPGGEPTYERLAKSLGGLVFPQPPQKADGSRDNLVLGLKAGAAELRRYTLRMDAALLADPRTSPELMESVYSAQRAQAAADLSSAAAGFMFAMAKARSDARERSYPQLWNLGLRNAARLLRESISGDYYARSWDDGKSAAGVFLVDLRSGKWTLVKTSPRIPFYFCPYMDYRLPVLSADASRLFVRGVGMDPGRWKAVKDKNWRIAPGDTVNVVPEPSLLAYDLAGRSFREPAEFGPDPFALLVPAPATSAAAPALSEADLAALKPVQANGRWGLADAAGRAVLEPRWDRPVVFLSDGYAVVEADKKLGVMDSAFKLLAPPAWAGIHPDPYAKPPVVFQDGLVPVHAGSTYVGTYGYLDKSGKLAVPLRFAAAEAFSEGLAEVVVKFGEGVGYIDPSGAFGIPPAKDFADGGRFSGGLAPMKRKNGNWGYIDRSGRFAVPAKYDWANPFSEGLGVVKSGKKWGAVDRTGAVVVPLVYSAAKEGFAGGKLEVELDGKRFLIDPQGRRLEP